MTWTLIVGLVGTVVALLQELRRRAAEARATQAEAAAELAGERAAGLEEALAGKRAEITALVEDLRACPDPAAAAALAERLLDDPWRGDHPALPR